MKKILITGANSYVGMAVENWMGKWPQKYKIDTLDMHENGWRSKDFAEYDAIVHVAGIAHADISNVSEEQKKLYYAVNTDLAIETAEIAKSAGVKQFIFMSSMIVYGGNGHITKKTVPHPVSFYGDSKWQADIGIRTLAGERFKVVILRPPMIYGKGSKGNYPKLAKIAKTFWLFPKVDNKRSMLYIVNLCEFIRLMIENEESGVFFPQNMEYGNTTDLVQMIAAVKKHRIIIVPCMDSIVEFICKIPGKLGGLATKAFSDSIYDMDMSEYKVNYRMVYLAESIKETEE